MSSWMALLMVLVLVEYFVLGFLVGRQRNKVLAPAMSGPPEFERALRAQQNTAERLVFFFPALWLAGAYANSRWAVIFGAVWLLGNTLYAAGYIQEAKKRIPGALVRVVGELGLLGMAGYGVVRTFM